MAVVMKEIGVAHAIDLGHVGDHLRLENYRKQGAHVGYHA
jgi:hypothetical protein